jgi:hypothetical protein
VSGKVDVSKMVENERVLKEKKEKEERIRKMKVEEKRQEAERKIINGNKGKGEKDNYLKFCRFCFIEFEIDIPNCTHCNKELITRQVYYI